MSAEDDRVRRRLSVRGIVQGVGFRPFVYALARKHALAGFVGNDSAGVFIEVEGSAAALDRFERELCVAPPPLALVEAVAVETIPPRGEADFRIVESAAQPGVGTSISPDICICDDCLRELFDPSDRRYRYPFINCTNCGPRFTIIKDIPYDRPLTTMADFAMCPACAAEYRDPSNRRFHAQPNACPTCGPQVWFTAGSTDAAPTGAEAFAAAQAALLDGRIVAVKGIGGFHLACDATNDAALRVLRERKGRVDKPFALMARDLDVVRRFAQVTHEEAGLLTSKERPIVLLRKRADDRRLSALVAPGNAYVGVMLPYTPLHYLLLDGDLHDVPLVMTSGNYSDEPIVKDNDIALDRLRSLADAFLVHSRDIHMWCDDSVVRAWEGRALPIRRSRGYTPFPVALSRTVPCVLAAGGELKATFCLTKDRHAYMSQHIGDMGNLETLRAFERAVAHFMTLFRARPERIACDLHPGYLSTRWAEQWAAQNGLPLVRVQHHHAHIASLIAEHGLPFDRRVIGISFDGTGYGSDGAIWGGEVLVADCAAFTRIAHLRYVPLPGGDAAIKRPYRSALAHLWAAGLAWDDDLPCVAACPAEERRVLRRQLERNVNCVPTSSLGRLFDAVASLVGVRQTVTYEAQAAIELEAMCADDVREAYKVSLDLGDPILVDPAPMLRAIIADLRAGRPVGEIVARVHNTFADLIVALSEHARRRTGLAEVGLSGGVFQNVRLLALAVQRLRERYFQVLTHRRVPPNDGGLALGQAAIAVCVAEAIQA